MTRNLIDPKIKESFGERLKELRQSKAISQVELAASIGISATALCSIERGTTGPSRQTFNSLSKYFGAEFDEILVQDLEQSSATDLAVAKLLKVVKLRKLNPDQIMGLARKVYEHF
jgi:transcriptional regulator with XRE-family HTH domain